MTSNTLERFRLAQDCPNEANFASAMAELETTGKRGHWIWYVFPQIEGLGASLHSQLFAIHGREEAADYLRDALLRSRLLTISRVVADRLEGGRSLESLMGSAIDAQKTVSSLTLFEYVARSLQGGREKLHESDECVAVADVAARVLAKAEEQGYQRCEFTLRSLRR